MRNILVSRDCFMAPCGCLQFVIVVFPDHTRLLYNSVFFLQWGLYFHLSELKINNRSKENNPFLDTTETPFQTK